MMILGRETDMQDYYGYLTDTHEEVKQFDGLLARFKFWMKNYFSFLREGMDIYENGDRHINQANIPLLYETDSRNDYGIEHSLLNILSRVMNYPSETK